MDAPDYVEHAELERWVAEMTELCTPDEVVWCDGSDDEYDRLCQELSPCCPPMPPVHLNRLQTQPFPTPASSIQFRDRWSQGGGFG